MSERKKTIAKVLGLLVALLGGAGGADMAGVVPDLDQLQQIGGGLGSLVLVGYLHFVWFPLFKRAGDRVEAIALQVGAVEAPMEVVQVATGPIKRAATSPGGLSVVKNGSES